MSVFTADNYWTDSPDASGVGPVTGHTSTGQQGGDGLVKQEVVSDQLLLLGIGHGLQGVVLSLELTIQAGQSWREQGTVRKWQDVYAPL